MLHESGGMRTRRRRETGNPHAERLPDTIARLVTFTILTGTRSGRAKTAQIRVLTTLLDHKAFPAREIAALYSERWQIETAFLHLKKTVRGPRRPLRGQSPELARQEAWALLLIHNIVATAAARAAAEAGTEPRLIPFTAVLGLIRDHVAADVRCQALRAPPRHRKRPDHRPDRRHHLPSPPPSRTSADLRENRGRTPHQPNRGSHIHHRHHKVESPEMGHNSGNLRAVGTTLTRPGTASSSKTSTPGPAGWKPSSARRSAASSLSQTKGEIRRSAPLDVPPPVTARRRPRIRPGYEPLRRQSQAKIAPAADACPGGSGVVWTL
jgi:hypothetical protein